MGKRHRRSSGVFKPTTLLKVTLLHGCFSRFLNCIDGTKSRKKSHIQSFQTKQKLQKIGKLLIC